MTLLQICIVGLLLSAVIEFVILLVQRWNTPSGPRCGGCGYNLTGAPSNRCAECGSLFVEAGIVTRKTQPPRRMLAVVTLASLAAIAGGLAVLQNQQLKAAATANTNVVSNAVLAQRNAALTRQNTILLQIDNARSYLLTVPASPSSAEIDAASERMMIRDLLYRRDQSPERMLFQKTPNYDPSGMWRPR